MEKDGRQPAGLHDEIVAAILTVAFVPLLTKTIDASADQVVSKYHDVLAKLRAKHG